MLPESGLFKGDLVPVNENLTDRVKVALVDTADFLIDLAAIASFVSTLRINWGTDGSPPGLNLSRSLFLNIWPARFWIILILMAASSGPTLVVPELPYIGLNPQALIANNKTV